MLPRHDRPYAASPRASRLSPAPGSAALAVILLATLAPLPAVAQSANSAPLICADALTRRELLRDERGHFVQFTRNGFAARNGEVMITGAKSTTFGPDASGAMQLSSQDSVVALLRRQDGSTTTIAAPAVPGKRVYFTLPVPLPDGQWGVLLTTEHADTTAAWPVPGPVLLLTIASNGTLALTEIPLPPRTRPRLALEPAVATLGDRLVIALPVVNEAVGEGETAVLLLDWRKAGWTSRLMPFHRLSYIALTFDGAKGDLALAAAHPDTRALVDGNSLFVYFPDRAGNVAHLVAAGGKLPIHQPRIAPTPTGVMLAWYRSDNPGAAYRPEEAEFALVHYGTPRAPVGTGVMVQHIAALGTASQQPLLLLALEQPDKENELTLMAPPANRPRVRVRVPTAGAPVTQAVLLSDGPGSAPDNQLLVTHPVVLGGGTHLANELLWISTRCDASDGAS